MAKRIGKYLLEDKLLTREQLKKKGFYGRGVEGDDRDLFVWKAGRGPQIVHGQWAERGQRIAKL